jgi:hypothetical protein
VVADLHVAGGSAPRTEKSSETSGRAGLAKPVFKSGGGGGEVIASVKLD